MNKFSLLNRHEYKISDNIIVHIPTVGEIRNEQNDENEYYRIFSVFIKTPCDAMVELDDIGIDYTQVSEYELFLMIICSYLDDKKNAEDKYWDAIFPYLKKSDLTMLNSNGKIVIVNKNNEIVIDENVYGLLSDFLRTILNVEKNMEYYKVPELETRKYIIDRQRLKQKREIERQKRNKKQKSPSVLDGVILFLVNNCNFKYDFDSIQKITIYDLWACYKQISTNKEIDGIMTGYWMGNVDLKKIDNSKLNRLIL